MIKKDELLLAEKIIERGSAFEPCTREIATSIGMNLKRMQRICEKWESRGLYDWGGLRC